MLYFGKTSKKDPYTYNGSGKYWKNHLQKHGSNNVETIWVSEPFTNIELLIEFATLFSEHFDIVNCDKWGKSHYRKWDRWMDTWFQKARFY